MEDLKQENLEQTKPEVKPLVSRDEYEALLANFNALSERQERLIKTFTFTPPPTAKESPMQEEKEIKRTLLNKMFGRN